MSAVFSLELGHFQEAQPPWLMSLRHCSWVSLLQNLLRLSVRPANYFFRMESCRLYHPTRGASLTQVIVPTTMRQLVLQQLHDHSGYLGVAKTLGKVKERFYWPGYERDVEEWVLQCQPCQHHNPLQHNPRAPLGTVRAHHPFEKVSSDIMGPLPYILVVTDLFTKWVEAFSIQATDSQTLASVFVKEIVSLWHSNCITQ